MDSLIPDIPMRYVWEIARALPVGPHATMSTGAQLEANKYQAMLWVRMIWEHAFHAGMTQGYAHQPGQRWMVVTPEERDQLVASINKIKEEA